jgi:hypothetical protein
VRFLADRFRYLEPYRLLAIGACAVGSQRRLQTRGASSPGCEAPVMAFVASLRRGLDERLSALIVVFRSACGNPSSATVPAGSM